MIADAVALIAGVLVFAASLISLRAGVSVAIIAQKWFMPVHAEDVVETNGNGGIPPAF